MSGCLLFTDPINKAPTVSITGPDQVTRGIEALYTADAQDEDSPASLDIEWAEFGSANQGCDSITPDFWPWQARKGPYRFASTAAYPFKAEDTNVACLCVRATDHYGAFGQTCKPITPVNQPPIAKIVDVSGVLTNQTRQLCSQIELSPEQSRFPLGDQIAYNWAGTDPNGSNVQLVACNGASRKPTDTHRCFYAAAPGTYTVTLSITDTPSGGSTTDAMTSQPDQFVVPVDVDRPPCLQQTDPDKNSRVLFVSHIGDVSSDRQLTVLSASDDCEPYPVPAGSGKRSAQFLWSVYDTTKATKPVWVFQANTTNSFTVSPANYSAQPADFIKVRVEVRDQAAQQLAQSSIFACSSDQTDICCGAAGCTGNNDCIRWTTWTVNFY